MTFPKFLAIFAGILFTVIGVAALFKSSQTNTLPTARIQQTPLEVELDQEIRMVVSPPPAPNSLVAEMRDSSVVPDNTPLPEADHIQELFNTKGPKLPIVQTIIYRSQAPWQKGRPAWLSDYASHYSTSRHFIARSLNGKPDYFKQDIVEGNRFNVLNPDKHIAFHLIIDTSRSKMWFYYIDQDTLEKVLLKTYIVGLGRIDSSKASGMLTPIGTYKLGSKIAIYKPKTTGLYNGQKIQMIEVFGTRWIPFAEAISNSTAPPEGFGLHGVPWIRNEKGELVPNDASLGKYESDGCIRLSTPDIEELFAIVISRPTTVELVKDFHQAKLD